MEQGPLPPPPTEMPPQPPPPPPSSQFDHGQFHAQHEQASGFGAYSKVESEWALKARAWAMNKEASANSDASGNKANVGTPKDYSQNQKVSANGFAASRATVWPSTMGAGTQVFGKAQGAPLATSYQPAVQFGYARSVSSLPVMVEEKKRTVPSWLREELRKKAATSTFGIASDTISMKDYETEVSPTFENKTASSPTKNESDKEEDEDDIETIRTAAINNQIKNILNEVLFKVTDGIFNEIAEEILNEGKRKSQDTREEACAHASEARVVLAALDGEDSSRAGNPLGLAGYESDDATEEEPAGTNALHTNAGEVSEEAPKVYGPVEPEEIRLRRCEEQSMLLTPPSEARDRLKIYDSDMGDDREKRDKQHNKENEDVRKKDAAREEHRRRKHSRKKSRHDRSVSPRRSSRSSRSDSPASPRKRKSRRRSRSSSPERRRREHSRSRSPSSRENRRHRNSRSRSVSPYRRRRR